MRDYCAKNNRAIDLSHRGIIVIETCVILTSIPTGKGGCRDLHFIPCVQNKTLTGHVIQTSRILSPGSETCQENCFLEGKCISYNLGPIQEQIRSCELSDADHVSDPGDVVQGNGSEYCAVKVLRRP